MFDFDVITGPPARDNWVTQLVCAEIDLLRGDAAAAAERLQLILAIPTVFGRVEFAREAAYRAAEAALWVGRPGDALAEVQRVLPLVKSPDLAVFFGRLLAAGITGWIAFQAVVLTLGGRKLAWRVDQGIGVVSVASSYPTSGSKSG